MYAFDNDSKQRLFQRFNKLATQGQLHRDQFENVLADEVIDMAMKKAHGDTLERWTDLTELGVLMEVWGATFGNTESISFESLCQVFESKTEDDNTEIEKLLDLLSEDEALRNQMFDLEQCLQSNKDMLAASDILVEEQAEKVKSLEEGLGIQNRVVDQLRQQIKELENLKTKVKNMESEHRLLKRDFDLVFATNKSVHKKMERTEMENRSLRKTIISLANQMGKIERENQDLGMAPPQTLIPVQIDSLTNAFNTDVTQFSQDSFITHDMKHQNNLVRLMTNPQEPEQNWTPQNRPHMVWDPAVQALVPIGLKMARKTKKLKTDYSEFAKEPKRTKKKWNNDNSVNNGRLISPFPRRYTSSHLPRYRRKFEMTECRKQTQSFV